MNMENQNRTGIQSAGNKLRKWTRMASSPAQSGISFGYQTAGGMMVFAGMGYLLDQKLNRDYLFTLSGVFLGFLYILYEAWKLVKATNQPEKHEDSSDVSERK